MSSLHDKLAHFQTGPGITAPGLSLTTVDHVRLAHPVRGRGEVVLASAAGGGWFPWRFTAADLPEQAQRHAGADDQYVSHHAFLGGQDTRHLLELRACHVDLDTYTVPNWQRQTPDWTTTQLLAAIAEASLPVPSLVLFTGRGLHVTWLLDPVPARALPRWRAVQARLAILLSSFGADAAAGTATSSTRLVGTFNSRSGRMVVPTFVHPNLLAHGHRWTLDAMAEHTLPLGRRELADLRVARQAERDAKQAAKNAAVEAATDTTLSGRRRPVTRCTSRTYWVAVLKDLQRLLRHDGGMLPSGGRNNWLVCCAVALAWLVPAAELEAKMVTIADKIADWTPKQTHNALSSVLARARQAEAGHGTEQGGTPRDPRYRYRAATIVAMLDITPLEMRAANLRVLVDRDRARALATERKRASRRRAGVATRAAYERAQAVRTLAQARATLSAVAVAGSIAAAAHQAGITAVTMRKRHTRAATLVAMRDTLGHGG